MVNPLGSSILKQLLLALLRNLLLIVLLELEDVAAEERMQSLRNELGTGRGHTGPRAQQRHFHAIDVYAALVEQGDQAFVDLTGFNRIDFDDLCGELAPLIRRNRLVRHGVHLTGRLRSTKLTLQNRLLCTLKFLVVGGSTTSLGHDFGVDHHVVSEDIIHCVHAIVAGLKYEITWPSDEQINLLIGTFGPNFPDVIGSVDCTFTPTLRHEGDFSGHRGTHVRSHQVVADAFGFILDVVAGQPGSRHDHHHFALSGLDQKLEQSGVRLLGDDGYQGLVNIQPPASRRSVPDFAERVAINIDHTNRRSRIEQFFSVLKQWFTAAGRKWTRVDRRFLSVVFVACCLLYNRRKRLNP
jgi:hypothetical protein